MKITNIINDGLIDFIINRIDNIIFTESPGLNLRLSDIGFLIDEYYNSQIRIDEDVEHTVYTLICKKAPLCWQNYEALAYCLNSEYPNTDLIEIKDEEIIEMVKNLSNFIQSEVEPPEDIVTAILTIWIEIYYNNEL